MASSTIQRSSYGRGRGGGAGVSSLNEEDSQISGHSTGFPDPLHHEKEFEWKNIPEETFAREHEKRKIMSEELMWQRELVCKKKLENVRKQACNYFEASPSTFLRAPSNSKPVGTKRQAPSENISYRQPQMRQQYEDSFETQPDKPKQAILSCKVCQVIVSGEHNLKQHYQGKKHRDKLEEMEIQKIGGKLGTDPVTCEVCKVLCMNENCYQQHLLGKKHAACLQVYNNAKAVKSGAMFRWEEF